ncbi:phosphoglycerate mutase family protein [Lysobacter sp. Root690]|uniref:phosphoglycerate mutase family protein n=1 Tax=Lysobacter sp. Root690 TaxID=1736588 RepID=UPI00138F9C54|nr:phosphoglycerate mutase family protein [Lysobacter sp. Root690]
MAPITRLSALGLSVLLAACASAPPTPTPGASFVIVRHAEKANDDPRDPSLSEAGRARAQRLAAALKNQPMRAVYATAYRRTQQTGEPTAQSHRLQVVTYDAKQPATDFAATLRREHAAGTVLVVAHSNTAPDIAAALCQCTVAPMTETEFDRRMRIDFDRDGHPSYSQSRDQ